MPSMFPKRNLASYHICGPKLQHWW